MDFPIYSTPKALVKKSPKVSQSVKFRKKKTRNWSGPGSRTKNFLNCGPPKWRNPVQLLFSTGDKKVKTCVFDV